MSPRLGLDLFNERHPDFLIIELLSDDAPACVGFTGWDLIIETVPCVTIGDRLSPGRADI